MRLVYRFSPLSSIQEHDSIQAGMVQEELKVLHLHPKEARNRLRRQLGGVSPSPPPEWYTFSNKATPSNSATPWAKHMQTVTSSLYLKSIYKPVCSCSLLPNESKQDLCCYGGDLPWNLLKMNDSIHWDVNRWCIYEFRCHKRSSVVVKHYLLWNAVPST